MNEARFLIALREVIRTEIDQAIHDPSGEGWYQSRLNEAWDKLAVEVIKMTEGVAR